MRVMVTGANGFIGTNLLDELCDHGHYVAPVDCYVHPYDRAGYQEIYDLLHPQVARSCIRSTDPDVVVHLAAQVGRLRGEMNPEYTIRANAVMTDNVARACVEYGVKLVYASTSEVYGDRGNDVCYEDDPLYSLPHNLYGLSKRWGEEVVRMHHFNDRMRYYKARRSADETVPPAPVILRFSMPYGPGVPPGRGRAALPNILWQASNRAEIPVHSDTERSWCWIGDTVRAVRIILEANSHGIFNVGRDDDPRSMLDLAHYACDLVDCPPANIVLVDPPQNQTLVKRLSTEKIRALGWSPEVSIEDGMRRTLDWVSQFDASGKKAA